MSLHSFRVEAQADVVRRDRNGFPIKKPEHAAINPEPWGFWVHAAGALGSYAHDCAVALGRACRGKVFDKRGKLVEDATQSPKVTWNQLVKAWGEIDKGLAAKKEARKKKPETGETASDATTTS